VVSPAATAIPRASKFDTRSVDFAIAFSGEVSAYRELSTFILPGASFSLEAVNGPPGDYSAHASTGAVSAHGARSWQWRAPLAPGMYDLKIDGPSTKEDVITLHAFVMVPAARAHNGLLNGYSIGQYPAKLLNGNPIYERPAGFVEVTRDNQDTRLSPHFTLKQFLCKEDTTKRFPKYVVLRSGCSSSSKPYWSA